MRLGVSTDYVAIGLVVMAVLILAAVATFPSSKTVTLTRTSAPSITTITSLVTTPLYSTYLTTLTSIYTVSTLVYTPSSNSTAVPLGCPRADSYSFGTLNVTAGSSVTVCFQIYDFNATSTFRLNATQLLQIGGYPLEGGMEFFTQSNFTISSSPQEVTMGGPSNINEGVIVSYSITPRPGVSGSYWVGMFGGPAILDEDGAGYSSCGGGRIVVGSGEPNYTWACNGGCICGPSGPEYFMVPGLAYPLAAGAIYYRVAANPPA